MLGLYSYIIVRVSVLSIWIIIGLISTLIGLVQIQDAFSQSQKIAAPPEGQHPKYNKNGDLLLPPNTEEWVFVGSNLGLSYAIRGRFGTPDFHNVYISPFAYEVYRETGEFPQGTMLILDRYERAGKSPQNEVLTDGYFNGQRIGFEISVKDKNRPNRREDSRAEWAYYAFSGQDVLEPTARAFADQSCQACHETHAKDDHVWVQFYPVLRRIRKLQK